MATHLPGHKSVTPSPPHLFLLHLLVGAAKWMSQVLSPSPSPSVSNGVPWNREGQRDTERWKKSHSATGSFFLVWKETTFTFFLPFFFSPKIVDHFLRQVIFAPFLPLSHLLVSKAIMVHKYRCLLPHSLRSDCSLTDPPHNY